MKTITAWNDLAPYGIVMLTGEACGLNYRLLCDVTAKGKAILEKLFSVSALSLHPHWNCGSPDDPHVGSILLTPELLLPLGLFALLESGCTEVWWLNQAESSPTSTRALFGIEPTDHPEHLVWLTGAVTSNHLRRFAYRGTAGDRNVHLLSGRVV
jgi:hypothetical protein